MDPEGAVVTHDLAWFVDGVPTSHTSATIQPVETLKNEAVDKELAARIDSHNVELAGDRGQKVTASRTENPTHGAHKFLSF